MANVNFKVKNAVDVLGTGQSTFNGSVNLTTGNSVRINNTEVLSSTTLGSSVINSSLTSVGTVTTGTWNASIISMAHGGTNANLTPVRGGFVYSTDTGLAVTSAGTEGQVLVSNGAAAPTWRTAYPTGSNGNQVFYENSQVVTSDYTITAGKSAMSAGPVAVQSGVTATVPIGSTWTIVSGN